MTHYTNIGRSHSLGRGLFARPTESERNVTLFVVALDASLRCFEAVRGLAFFAQVPQQPRHVFFGRLVWLVSTP